MKLHRFLLRVWASRPPPAWTEVFVTIALLLLIFLAASLLLNCVKGTLP